jgi:putative endonuclease
MNEFASVYILESLADERGINVGLTDDLSAHMTKHSTGGVPHTSKRKPWRIKTAIAFRDLSKAATFENYLKSPSGRAFGKKRLQVLPAQLSAIWSSVSRP